MVERVEVAPPEGIDAGTLTLIARQEIEYLAPVPYRREPLDVQLWFGRRTGRPDTASTITTTAVARAYSTGDAPMGACTSKQTSTLDPPILPNHSCTSRGSRR
jgi:hypothetical protein